MKYCHLAIALLLATSAGSAAAQTAVAQPNVRAEDVVTTPLNTLNIKKDEIPPILIAAREGTYDLGGLRSCRAIGAEIVQLDAVLGPDIDIAAEKTRNEKRGNTVGQVARSVINSFIPFNGMIREVTGAAAHDRQWQVALYAGASRRAFLKGYGQARSCRYPARSATAAQVAALNAAATTGSAPPPPKAKAPPRKRAKARRRG